MEMTHAPHIQQPRHPRHRETVRRALGGTIEFRHFTGFDQLFAPHAHGYPVIGLVREGTASWSAIARSITWAPASCSP